MQEKIISVKGKQIAYRIIGKGSPVILLHGFGEDGTIWDRQYHAFSDVQMIIPDLPGTGKSEITADMSIEGLAATIHDFVKALGIEKSILIGHSMGGYIALAYVEKFADTLTGFGLFHSTAYADSEEKKETRKKGIEFIRKNGAFEFLKTATPNLYAPKTKADYPELIEEHVNSTRDFTNEALIHYYKAMIQRPDRTNILRETKLPVLFIMGRHDNAVPIKDVLEQCHLPVVSFVHVLEYSGHMGMREEAENCNEILRDFNDYIQKQPSAQIK